MNEFIASDGTPIAYEDMGEGRPLLLLHGLMAHSGFFAPQRELASDFRVISVDLRGHGRSARTRAVSVELIAADVEALAGALGLEGAVAVGWSLGASVLWKMLSGPAAARVAATVIVDMTPRVLNEGNWELGLSPEACEARRIAIREDFPAFARAAGHAIFAQPVRDDLAGLAEWAGEEFARNDPALMDALWQSLVQQDFRKDLGRITQPSLIVHGAHSHLYGAGTADYLANHLSSARTVQFDRSGHAPHLEEPRLFNTVLRDFAAGMPRPLVTTDQI